MIQRIQTLWLIFTTVLPVSLIQSPILKFTGGAGEKVHVGFRGIYKLTGQEYTLFRESFGLPITIILISIFSLATILLFRYRKIQKILSLVVIALSVCLLVVLGFYSYLVYSGFNASLQPGLNMIPPFIIIICSVMAYRGIIKDDNLVKSYDRLR